MEIQNGRDRLYAPLQHPDSIRLLKLHAGDSSSSLSGLLLDRRLADEPNYVALSYMWGQKEHSHHIRLDGVMVPLRRNLFNFLNAIRSPDVDMLVWADYLCIDQHSVREKNHQVRQIGRIFHEASSVFAWLGEGNAQTDTLMSHFKERPFAEAVQNAQESFQPAIQDLLSKPYWSRTWIIQELVLAQQIVFFCGRRTMAERHILTINGVARKECGGATSLPTKAIARSILEQRWDRLERELFSIHRPRLEAPPEEQDSSKGLRILADLAKRYQKSCCEDRLDKLYALLSLLPQQPNGPPLKADYDIGILTLFDRVVTALLRTIGSKPTRQLADDFESFREVLGIPEDILMDTTATQKTSLFTPSIPLPFYMPCELQEVEGVSNRSTGIVHLCCKTVHTSSTEKFIVKPHLPRRGDYLWEFSDNSSIPGTSLIMRRQNYIGPVSKLKLVGVGRKWGGPGMEIEYCSLHLERLWQIISTGIDGNELGFPFYEVKLSPMAWTTFCKLSRTHQRSSHVIHSPREALQGYLYCKFYSFQQWELRWFMLKDGLLHHWKHRNDVRTKQAQTINIDGFHVSTLLHVPERIQGHALRAADDTDFEIWRRHIAATKENDDRSHTMAATMARLVDVPGPVTASCTEAWHRGAPCCGYHSSAALLLRPIPHNKPSFDDIPLP